MLHKQEYKISYYSNNKSNKIGQCEPFPLLKLYGLYFHPTNYSHEDKERLLLLYKKAKRSFKPLCFPFPEENQ